THTPPAMLDHMRPWFATVVAAQGIAEGVGWSADRGADVVLDREALAQGKPVRGFETPELQMQLFAAMPEDAQLALLRTSFADAGDAGKAKLDALARAWAAGDDAAAAVHLVAELKAKSPELYARMLVARNRAWIPQIQTMLKTPGVRMIAVGEGHLLGPDGVPALLKAAGVRITRVH
ncbi:MAG: TraB/GumN family protein, partial [Bryobacteraceae bacterium]